VKKITIYCKNHTEHIYKPHGQITDVEARRTELPLLSRVEAELKIFIQMITD
jgi:hypothetical protein